MGDKQNRFAQQFLQAQKLILHFAPDQRIQRRKGLIQKPDFRAHRQGAGNAHALLLATRQLARKVALTAFQPHELEHLAGFGFTRRAVAAADLQRKRHVVQHIAVRQQAEILEHHAHFVAPDFNQFLGGGGQQIAAIHQHLTGSRVIQAGDRANQGGLARPRQTHDDQDLVFHHIEGHIAHRADVLLSGKSSGIRLHAVLFQKALRIRSEHFPQVAADNFRLSFRHSPSFTYGSSKNTVGRTRRPTDTNWYQFVQAFTLAWLLAIHFLAASSGFMPSTSTMAAAAAIWSLVKLTFLRILSAVGHLLAICLEPTFFR